MTYYFHKQALSEAELLWLKEMYAKVRRGEDAHHSYLQATLWKKIPVKFDGSSIDKRLVFRSRLTLLGILHIDPESDFIPKIDLVICTIRNLLLNDSKSRRLSSTEIANLTGLSVGEVNIIFDILDDLKFVGARSNAKSGGSDAVEIGWPSYFQQYLEYENMEVLINRIYGEANSKEASSPKESSKSMERLDMVISTVSKPKVFIGHGRSVLWARLKIFINDELGLDVISYESESRIGDSIVLILQKMLDEASFAVLILTAEDETAEGTKRARQNVIHEAGLFQGRLGFKKAVLLKQEGLEDLSNVAGLQYIGFQGDRIDQTFYELQRVLKREGLLK